MDWKLNDVEPQGSSNGFWYDITNGYIKLEELISDKEQLDKLKEAVIILESFEDFLQENDLLIDI